MDRLASFVPPLLAGRPAGQPWLDRFPAAVLLADLCGFTRLAEELARQGPDGAERLSALLDRYFEQLFEIFHRHGGQVVKIAGDAPIVAFPGPLSEAVPRAAACALEAAALSQDGLTLRLGLGAGEAVLAGVGGHRGRWEFVLAGEPLEQASSAERLAQPGQVTVAEPVWAFLPDARREGPRLLESPPVPWLAESAAPGEELQAYLSSAVLDRLQTSDAWLAELRPVSVLFLCLRKLDYQAANVLERLHQAVLQSQQVLESEEASLIQCLMDDKGTILLAAFGVPRSHPDDALRAIRAGLELAPLGSIGIATGRVFCGIRGSPRRREYCLIGDRVNLAARLMQKGDALCDPETARLVRDRVQFEQLEPIALKGKSQTIAPHRPLGLSDSPSASAPLVGRKRERQQLERLLDGPGKLLLEGEPGLGKSRLVQDLLEECPLPVVLLQADPVGQGIPGSVFRELDRPDRDWLERHPLAPLAAELAGQSFSDNAATRSLTGAARGEALRELLLDLTDHWANQSYLVIVEDAHWLDSVSRGVLMQAPGRLLLVARPGHGLDGLERLGLDPLDEEAILALARARTGAQQLDARLLRLLREKAEGNPFFTEELLLALDGAGLLEQEGETLRLKGEPELLQLLDTVGGAITSRIDRLEPAHQLALKVASVVGRIFALAMVAEVRPAEAANDNLEAIFGELDRLELTPRLDTGRHAFKHALTREAAYNTLLYSQRRELHRAVAQREIDPVQLAHHWWEAGEPEQAYPYLAEVGERALHQGAFPEAAGLLRRALEAAPPQERARLSRLLAEACYGAGDLVECRRHLVSSLESKGCRVPRSRSSLWTSPHWWQFWLLERPFSVPGQAGRKLADWFDRSSVAALAGPTARLCGRPAVAPSAQMEAVLAWDRLTMVEALAGELDLSFHAGGELVARAEALGGPSPVLARAYAMMAAGCSTTLPLPRLADLYHKHSLQLARELGDPVLMARVLYCLSTVAMSRADWTEAELMLKEARQLSIETRDARQAAECQVILADVLYSQGKLQAALAAADEVLIEGRARCDPQQEVHARNLRSLVLSLSGRSDEARACLAEARPLVEVRDAIGVANWRGASALAEGHPAVALPLLRGVDRLPSPHWCRLGVFWASYLALLRGELALGARGARYLLNRARFFPLCAPGAWLCNGLWQSRRGKDGRPSLERSLALAEAQQMPLEASLAEHHLGRVARLELAVAGGGRPG